ncbi:hypothetical protein [Bacillus oleivorans]|uniref:hypothetical protein n=1 Tax=Bacillus oleivorans TaxID=1448271 RepID=UPI000BE370DF|nr:hypothetical protein [Bacillus oleivorans]
MRTSDPLLPEGSDYGGCLRTTDPLSVTNWPIFKISGHWFRYLTKFQQFSAEFRQITDRMSDKSFKITVFGEIADRMSAIFWVLKLTYYSPNKRSLPTSSRE